MTSRVAKVPVTIPNGVTINLSADQLSAEGKLGKLTMAIHRDVTVKQEDNLLVVTTNNSSKEANAQSGTVRALANNLVAGVSQGFEKKLKLVGVGYRAQVQGKKLNLSLGFSHPVDHDIPEGITIETPVPTEIVIKGANKQVVGQIAADIRRYRPPEPYKGKGVRYADEVVSLKETKKK